MNPWTAGLVAWLAACGVFLIIWWVRTKPSVPAANTPRVPGKNPGAGKDAGPPVLMRPQPAPGQDPVPGQRGVQRAANGQRPAPAPDTDCGPVHAGIGFNREGCMFTWKPGWGHWEHKQHRLPFNVAEWEARLPP